ncbi:MAG: shikimate kinase [Alphaproteobacteria bacterium]|nr:shikimate kinase [Alphaproteobacteria bacterium]MAS46693.1 shikimate kinase [Alphaproteobacteria bacterium]MAX94788.1 shikimate kinase [Alphaproteobacteria bacterium]MBN53759.1 shikimate kinase [Alphaproteobacteria bacterium]OUT41728.1 MAG: shikimate kinase [Micavibrio sp. TMED2]|tara:strand:- start:7576 stop:8148 length:573 start_codon:yes stop_codon:yes gene_type:complete
MSVGKLDRSIVMVGLMGAGKSSIGRRLANRLGLPFVDADNEIEKAAGCSISEIFDRFGEAAFRDGERKVIKRLMDGKVQVLSTGGGAFMDPETRELISQEGVSVWLRADLDLLVQRCSRRNTRPLLQKGDPKEILQKLIDERYPVYGQADITVDAGDRDHEDTVDQVIRQLGEYIDDADARQPETAGAHG